MVDTSKAKTFTIERVTMSAEETGAALAGCFIVLIVLVCIVFCPLIIIWCINTLWGTSTAYTFFTWLAALCFSGSGTGIIWLLKS